MRPRVIRMRAPPLPFWLQGPQPTRPSARERGRPVGRPRPSRSCCSAGSSLTCAALTCALCERVAAISNC
eukprot:3959136-Pyramimonas_sp.AAC.1